MRALRRFARGERGAVAAIFALALPALAGFAALSVDVGSVYLASRKLQGVADLAAMAAARDPSRTKPFTPPPSLRAPESRQSPVAGLAWRRAESRLCVGKLGPGRPEIGDDQCQCIAMPMVRRVGTRG